jgi:hypothetical protein
MTSTLHIGDRVQFQCGNCVGSVRRVWLWLRSEGLSFPLQTRYGGSIRWVDPSYIAIYHVLTNPVYAGEIAVWYDATSVDEEKTTVRRLNRLAGVDRMPFT